MNEDDRDTDKLKGTPGGGALGISGWGCAAGTMEPLTYTRASSAEFCYPILNCLKTIPFTAAHTHITHIWQYPPPPREGTPVKQIIKKINLLVINKVQLETVITGVEIINEGSALFAVRL